MKANNQQIDDFAASSHWKIALDWTEAVRNSESESERSVKKNKVISKIKEMKNYDLWWSSHQIQSHRRKLNGF